MITHSIIKSKERFRATPHGFVPVEVKPNTAPQLPLLQNSAQERQHAPVLPHTYLENEYDAYLGAIDVKVGSFVTYRRTQRIIDPAAISAVICVLPYMKRTQIREWRNGQPAVFYCVQVFPTTPQGYQRWETIDDIRLLTDDEHKFHIEPKLDNIRDYLKRFDRYVEQIQNTCL